jgi:putative ABC transport system permease protein
MSLVRRIAIFFARSRVGQDMAKQSGAFDRPLTMLRKIPRATVVILAVLALGLVVNAAIFAFAYLEFAGLYPHPDDLVVVRSERQSHDDILSAEDFLRLREQTTAFQDLHASTEGAYRINTQDGPENIAASLVTPGFYRMMGDRFYLGNDFTHEDGAPGGGHVVILAHAMWKRLGANPAIVGSILLMNREPYTVVGVLAPGLRDRGASVTVPLIFNFDQPDPPMNVIGRLKPGLTIQQAQADVSAIAVKSNKGWKATVEPMQAASLASERKWVLRLMLGVAGFVLLVECVSVANLLRLRSEAGCQLRVSPSPRFPLE